MRRIAFAIALAAPLLPLAADGAPARSPILDPRGYLRSYYQFDWDRLQPGPLKTATKEVLSKRELRSIEHATRKRLAHRRIDWRRTDWRDHAVLRFVCSNAGIRPTPEAERFMNAPAPPADWAAAAFDDGAWPRQRKPFLVGRPVVGFGVQNFGVRACFHRARFHVPEPAAARELTFEIVYRGGVRVFVNGREIARGHLPAGPITDDVFPEPYPLEAYVRIPSEISDRTQKRLDDFRKRGHGRWPATGLYIPEVFGRFRDAPHPHNQGDVANLHRGTTSITRSTWHRVQALRDRKLSDVRIPAALLRTGENVLAIEVRASRIHPIVCREGQAWVGWGNFSWAHAQINAFSLVAAGGVASALERPAGLQVWPVDLHDRLHDTEWGERSAASAPLRFVGARNGTYSAQLAVGSDRELSGLSVEGGALRSADGATLPASALRAAFMRPRPLSELSGLIGSRAKTVVDPLVGGLRQLRKHSPVDVDRLPPEQRVAALETVRFFDHIAGARGRAIPAGRCQGVWLYLRIPRGARAGVYRGSVRIAADGAAAVAVPVEAEVVDWHLPEPRDFRTMMALEQSPYGVAKQYGVKPWSAEHLAALTGSLKLLGRVGNDWLFVPVLLYTEFGNRDDSPIRWIRKADGRLTYDFSRLDRYLDAAAEHMCGGRPPRVVSLVVMHGNPANPPEVKVFEEASGKDEILPVAGTTLSAARRREIWGPFATALYAHMKARGMARSMFWGYAWDSEGDPQLKYLLEEFTPQVRWSMGGHALRTHPKYYTAFSWIYKVYSGLSMVANRHGWRNPALEFYNPRGGGSVLSLPGNSPAFGFRLAVDRGLTVGVRGLARLGVDYWQGTYYQGTRGGTVYLQPGMPVHVMFWPGETSADSSARFEAMVEGVQEAEARIFLEEMLDRGALPGPLAEKARRTVFEHIRSTAFIPAGVDVPRFLEYAAAGWQDRSRRLYRTAAEAAAAVGLDVDRTKIAVDLPARSQQRIVLKLRNWTASPRPWSARCQACWVRLEKRDGVASGIEPLPVVLDAAALRPGETARATIHVADRAGGRENTVELTARVSAVCSVSLKRLVFNVPQGGRDARSLTLMNHSGQPLRFRAAGGEPWLTVTPAAGELNAGGARLLIVAAAPTQRTARELASDVTITEERGPVRLRIPLRSFVIPPYTAPRAPRGVAVPLKDVPAGRLVRHGIMAHGIDLGSGEWMRSNDKDKPRVGPTMYFGWHLGSATLGGFERRLETALWVRPHHETVYNLAGSGYTAFSAIVGVPKELDKPQLHRDLRVSFEIHVDGRLVAQSGLMALGDSPRLLVAEGLGAARQIQLVTRLDSLNDSPRSLLFWAEPTFHKAE